MFPRRAGFTQKFFSRTASSGSLTSAHRMAPSSMESRSIRHCFVLVIGSRSEPLSSRFGLKSTDQRCRLQARVPEAGHDRGTRQVRRAEAGIRVLLQILDQPSPEEGARSLPVSPMERWWSCCCCCWDWSAESMSTGRGPFARKRFRTSEPGVVQNSRFSIRW